MEEFAETFPCLFIIVVKPISDLPTHEVINSVIDYIKTNTKIL